MKTNRHAAGFALIEVMIALLIIMVGLLGLAGLQGRSLTTQMEAYQRSQALLIAKDMASRINANRANASSYATGTDPLGTDSTYTCVSGGTRQEEDFCAWHTLLQGSSEKAGASNIGAMIGARGCVDYLGAAPDRLLVTVAWQGLVPTAAPPTGVTCAAGKFGPSGDETYRRIITIPITIADLTP